MVGSFWSPRLGHGPFGCWPTVFWKQLFYSTRPDVLTSKTRVPEWDKLQSEWRFLQALFCYLGPPSHILWNIKWPFTAVALVSVGMVWYEVIRIYTGKLPILDKNTVFYNGFYYSTFAMSLLLAFRIQRSYERWNQARSSIAGVGNGTTTIFMLAATWIKDQKLVDEFRRYCIVWPFAILQVCQNSKTLDPRAAKLLRPAEYKVYSGSRKGRQVVVTKVRQLAYDANLTSEQFMAMETAIAATWKSAGDSLRIRFQCMPHGLSLICTGFVEIWCLLLPICLWGGEKHDSWLTIIGVLLITILLLGVDELASQMEEPFRLLPLEDIVVTYERDINRIRDELQLLHQSQAEDSRADHTAAAAEPGTTPASVPGHASPTDKTHPDIKWRPPRLHLPVTRSHSRMTAVSTPSCDMVTPGESFNQSQASQTGSRTDAHVSYAANRGGHLSYQGRTTKLSRHALCQEIEMEMGSQGSSVSDLQDHQPPEKTADPSSGNSPLWV